MRLPPEYRLIRVLSPGPVTIVALAGDAEGTTRIVKQSAIARGAPAIAHEAEALRTLAKAGVDGVPRLVGQWGDAIAMEWIDLPPLDAQGDAMRATKTFGEEAVRAAFATLDAVHAAGVVHGDVSPANVLVGARAGGDGARAALIDFGLARLARPGADRAEDGAMAGDDGAFRGTLRTVAPEVARGEPFDARADDFAMAASLLEVATGVPLRANDAPDASPASVLVNAGSRPLDASHPWRSLAYARFPRTMADALFRCLAFDPRDRPRDAPRAW